MVVETEFIYSWRFSENKELRSSYRVMGSSEVAEFYSRVKGCLAKITCLNGHGPSDFLRLDISASKESEIIKHLKAFGLASCPELSCIWLRQNQGITLAGNLVAEHFYDIWYPSSDDLVVSDREFSFLTYVDHEEWICHFPGSV